MAVLILSFYGENLEVTCFIKGLIGKFWLSNDFFGEYLDLKDFVGDRDGDIYINLLFPCYTLLSTSYRFSFFRFCSNKYLTISSLALWSLSTCYLVSKSGLKVLQ